MSVIKTVNYGPEAMKLLNGIFCIYKPSGVPRLHVRKALCLNLCRDLNQLDKRGTSEIVQIKGSVCTNKAFAVEMIPNYADHELVSGPRYQEDDLRLAFIYRVGIYTSGVFLVTINDGCISRGNRVYRNFIRKYEIKGKFGVATKNFMSDGIVLERTTYRHIKQVTLDRFLAAIQAKYQSSIYKFSGFDVQSQKAYEAAASGLVKPAVPTAPLIYSIKCTEFNLPDFTLEVHCLNETESFLAELVYDIGVDLKSSAVCTQLRRTQYGPFNLSHALLRKHWTLENILNNVSLCKMVLDENPSSDFSYLKKLTPTDVIENMQTTARENCI